MKKSILFLMFCLFATSLYAATSKARLSLIVVDTTTATTYTMVQNKDSWIAAKYVDYSTGTVVSYKVDYTTITATDFISVWKTTNTWETAYQVANK